MNPLRAGMSGLMIFSGLVACAPAMFDKSADCGEGCVRFGDRGVKQIEYRTKVSGGVVDILFVNDNSGSMSFEQSQIANRFSTFLATLDSQAIDYRIAITTTDISGTNNQPRAINQNGALQDGNLIKFGNGSYFLDNSTANKQALFDSAIRRNETAQCESYLNTISQGGTSNPQTYYNNCPSADERGILAANLAIDKNPAGFIRGSGVHFAVVFLADEDIRSSQYDKVLEYRLSERDLPQNLINNFNSKFSGKSLSMHSLIVRPGSLKSNLSASAAADRIAKVVRPDGSFDSANRPINLFNAGDSTCLSSQGQQTNNVGGSYGYLYALGTRMTNGVEGNICASDYGSQLQAIGTNLGTRGREITVACANPTVIELKYQNQNGSPQGSFTENIFKVSDSEPIGTEIYLKIECPDV